MVRGKSKQPDVDWLDPAVDVICGNFELNKKGKIPDAVIEFLKFESSGRTIEWVGKFSVLTAA